MTKPKIHETWPLVGPVGSSKCHMVAISTVCLHTDHCKARFSQYFWMYSFKTLVRSFGKGWGDSIQAGAFFQQNMVSVISAHSYVNNYSQNVPVLYFTKTTLPYILVDALTLKKIRMSCTVKLYQRHTSRSK